MTVVDFLREDQQCIEKYLKAYLGKNDQEPPEIHDLLRLNKLCVEINPLFEKIGDRLEVLNAYAVDFRYPGEKATMEEAEEAMENAKIVRNFVREKLQIKEE